MCEPSCHRCVAERGPISNGFVELVNYGTWRDNFGRTIDGGMAGANVGGATHAPKPSSLLLTALAVVGLARCYRGRRPVDLLDSIPAQARGTWSNFTSPVTLAGPVYHDRLLPIARFARLSDTQRNHDERNRMR